MFLSLFSKLFRLAELRRGRRVQLARQRRSRPQGLRDALVLGVGVQEVGDLGHRQANRVGRSDLGEEGGGDVGRAGERGKARLRVDGAERGGEGQGAGEEEEEEGGGAREHHCFFLSGGGKWSRWSRWRWRRLWRESLEKDEELSEREGEKCEVGEGGQSLS